MIRGAALALAAALTLTACGGGGDDPLKNDGSGGGGGGDVVIGSADFPENLALAEIYAQALEKKGVKVQRKLKIGTREVYYKELERGAITLFPEYNGNLLLHVDKTATAATTADVNAALKQKLPPALEILDSAPAEDKDAVTVTQETAAKYGLKTIEDLKAQAKNLVFGGPSEFKTRQAGLVGLKEKYGLEFKEFKPLDTGGPLTVDALKKGDIQVANLFTTDAAITRNNFVALEDPKNVFPAQNVTPLVAKAKVNDTVRTTLNAISAKLTTQDLLSMNTKMLVDKADPEDVAAEWLKKAGLA
ncbi:glycine/betaine ABC transporter substrate-binding protein [Actinomadura craniellae]|uniref:Glycine/betaine ABC transporter substrate-binding protein n=2 Tax=Actinomadura craniellae TaxID=2231787 RepID=A0A365H5N9_9ACTN|nr:glycine/betaine ABC transporter substrate-binding protein [Actinomadura craniellae]